MTAWPPPDSDPHDDVAAVVAGRRFEVDARRDHLGAVDRFDHALVLEGDERERRLAVHAAAGVLELRGRARGSGHSGRWGSRRPPR